MAGSLKNFQPKVRKPLRHKNFNVVLPLADLCLGTLLLRARTHFAQARGPAVPDVQPLTPAPQVVAR